MTEIRCFLALVSYPAVFFLVYDWNGPGSRWARANHAPVLPPALKKLEEQRGLFFLPVKYFVLLIVLYGIGSMKHQTLVAVVSVYWPRTRLLMLGVVAGLLVFFSRRMLARVRPQIAFSESEDATLRGPTFYWLAIFATAACVEELWRALCISGFLHNGYSSLACDALTAGAFSFAHLSGLPSRIPAGLDIAAAETAIALIFGALFIVSGNFLVPCASSLIYYSLNYFALRRRYGLSSTSIE